MSETQSSSGRRRSIWKVAVSALPVGAAVTAFIAIRWPWDIATVVVLVGLAVLPASRTKGDHAAALGDTFLLYGALFLILFTGIGAYLTSAVWQQWLPVPLLFGTGVLGLLMAVGWVRGNAVRN